jgi:hypothetical protein
MRTLALVCCSIFLGVSVLSLPAVAQQKTVKACQEEWRANKTSNQAKGITEKAYVAQCRAGTAATTPAPAAPTAAAPPKAAPAPAPAASSRTAKPPAPAATAPAASPGANQYSAEAQAKARCGAGTVVWVNLNSKIYHFSGHRDYGHTKSGAYMCERDALSQGMRAAKNEKHP